MLKLQKKQLKFIENLFKMKTHKRKKVKRMHGKNQGTHGRGARKKAKGKGHRGGIGMSGTGKRSGQKQTLVDKKYGHSYFGKKGFTSIGTKKDKRDRINLRDIELKFDKLKNEKGEIILENYKILGQGEVTKKLIIKAKEASKSAIEKVKAKGGEIILPVKKVKEVKKEVKEEQKENGA